MAVPKLIETGITLCVIGLLPGNALAQDNPSPPPTSADPAGPADPAAPSTDWSMSAGTMGTADPSISTDTTMSGDVYASNHQNSIDDFNDMSAASQSTDSEEVIPTGITGSSSSSGGNAQNWGLVTNNTAIDIICSEWDGKIFGPNLAIGPGRASVLTGAFRCPVVGSSVYAPLKPGSRYSFLRLSATAPIKMYLIKF